MPRDLPKILLITLEFPPDRGGISRYYGEIVRHWPSEISVLKPRFWRLWPHWLPLLWRVGQQVKKEQIGMLWVGQVLPLGYVALWLKRRKKMPFVIFTHGMDILLPQKSWWKKRWLKKILGTADLVVANSEFTRGELAKLGAEEGKMVVVYPCPSFPLLGKEGLGEVDSLTPPSLPFPRGGEKIILSVGRLVKRKGFDKVIEILPRLLKRAPNLKYIIIGRGPNISYLLSLISSLDLEDKVSVLTQVEDEELVYWYNQSDVFVLPCQQIGGDVEGFGMVFLEAASFGKPVIVGNSGGASEAVHHGYGGYVINPNSEEELYQALVKLLTDENFAKRMGEYGREWVQKRFSWEREVDKLKERLKDIKEFLLK